MLIFVITVFVVVAAAAEVIFVDISADLASLAGTCLLIEAEVDPAVNAGIVDVSSYLRELGVVEGHVWNGRVRQSDVMTSPAEDVLRYRAPRVARGRVGRRIARKTRRRDEGCPGRIGVGLSVAVGVAGVDRGVRPPEDIVVFGFKRRDGSVADGHGEQHKGPRILGKRLALANARLISQLQRENLQDLLHNAERLLNQIDSLLEFSKIEAGKMEVHMQPVKVDEVIQRAISTIEPTLNGGSVRIIREIAPGIPALNTDREKLRQIILNLLDNAVKFTDRGEIKISASQQNGSFKLAVSDTGIGIEKENLNKIFEEFHRGESSSIGNYRGTGLGLAIVKKFVNLLGGDISVESEVGKGSVFTVTLPLDATTQPRNIPVADG